MKTPSLLFFMRSCCVLLTGVSLFFPLLTEAYAIPFSLGLIFLLGIPHGASLPNGWNYRFSVGQALSAELDSNGAYWNWENGVPPHTAVDLDPAQASQGFDSMIERAIVDLLSR